MIETTRTDSIKRVIRDLAVLRVTRTRHEARLYIRSAIIEDWFAGGSTFPPTPANDGTDRLAHAMPETDPDIGMPAEWLSSRRIRVTDGEENSAMRLFVLRFVGLRDGLTVPIQSPCSDAGLRLYLDRLATAISALYRTQIASVDYQVTLTVTDRSDV